MCASPRISMFCLLGLCWVLGLQSVTAAVLQSADSATNGQSTTEKSATESKPTEKPEAEELVSTEHTAEIAGR